MSEVSSQQISQNAFQQGRNEKPLLFNKAVAGPFKLLNKRNIQCHRFLRLSKKTFICMRKLWSE